MWEARGGNNDVGNYLSICYKHEGIPRKANPMSKRSVATLTRFTPTATQHHGNKTQGHEIML